MHEAAPRQTHAHEIRFLRSVSSRLDTDTGVISSEDLEKVLDLLPEESYSKAVALRFLGGTSIRAIARELTIKETAVNIHIVAAAENVAKLLNQPARTSVPQTPPRRQIYPSYPAPELEPSGNWSDDANCVEVDPEIFFPEKGDSTKNAKRICSDCTVREQCLEYAFKNDERFGVWGGLNEGERNRYRRRAARAHKTD